jgi:type III pantothenate kinase
MILLIDIGNTRIKWAELTDDGLGRMRADNYAHWNAGSIRKQMLSDMPAPERVLVANVGGDEIGGLVANSVAASWGLKPEFVRSTAHAGGVRNGYAIADQLGVDRWLAVIGAFKLERGAVCVASIGTAMTVDGVDAKGVHLGGIIVPGPNLAIESLLKNTSDIASRSRMGEIGPSLFAGNTLGAVHQGVVHMLAAVIERALLDTRMRLGESPTLYLTGGAGDIVGSSLRVPFRFVGDLVLQGLAVVARES